MIPRFSARELRAIILYGLAGLVFYQIGLLLLFFVIPLFLLHLRHGARAGLAGALFAFIGIGLVSYIRAVLILKAAVPLDALALGLSLPAVMLLGGIVTGSPVPSTLPRHFKLVIGTAVAAAGCLPLMFFMTSNAEFESLMRLQLKALTAELGPGEVSSLAAMAVKLLWNTFAGGIFLSLGLCWLIARRMQARAEHTSLEGRILAFRLPAWFVWLFLGSWAGVMAGLMIRLPLVDVLAWNCAIVASALFGFQGYAVIRFWITRVFREERVKVLVGGALLMILFIPGLNVVPLVAIPLLGVSEVWIDYRFQERGADS